MSELEQELAAGKILYIKGPSLGKERLYQDFHTFSDPTKGPWSLVGHSYEIDKRDDLVDDWKFERVEGNGIHAATINMSWKYGVLSYRNMIFVGDQSPDIQNSLRTIADFIYYMVLPAIGVKGLGQKGDNEFTAILSEMKKFIFDDISSESGLAFYDFLSDVDNSAGPTHPLDRRRWLNLLVNSFQRNEKMDAESLVQWLIDFQNWEPVAAERMAIEYKFAFELLSMADL